MDTVHPIENIEDKFTGAMFGLAIGDALGSPAEVLGLPVIKKKYGEKGVRTFEPWREFPPGTYSDDTQMSLAVAKGLIHTASPAVDEVMKAVIGEFISWAHSPDNNRLPGKTSMQGIRNLEQGTHWKASGVKDSKTCGAAMRSAPVGLLFYNDMRKLIEVADAVSRCTHGHPTAVSSGIATAYLTGLAVRGEHPSTYLPRMLAEPCFVEDFRTTLRKVPAVLAYTNEEKAMAALGEGWLGDETVALALYCLIKYPDSYKKAVLRAANMNGDADSVACITGALSGAYLGRQAIPNEWYHRIENSRQLGEVAKTLYATQKRLFHPEHNK